MPPFWLWPNLLSLDAPVVAFVWQRLIGRVFGIPIRPEGSAMLFLTVWAIYLADRLLDTRVPAAPAEPARHQFYRRYRTLATALLLIVTLNATILAFTKLRTAVLENGFFVFCTVALYFAVIHFWHWQGLKEITIAMLFSLGTFLVPITNAVSPRTLLLPALAFFLLCLANLVAIENWESRELAGQQAPLSPITRWLGRYFYYWVVPFFVLTGYALAPFYTAVSRSLLGFVLLQLAGRHINLHARRVLADAVLLTPLVAG